MIAIFTENVNVNSSYFHNLECNLSVLIVENVSTFAYLVQINQILQ